MTPTQTITLDELFTRYGHPCDTAEPQIRGFFSSPAAVLNPDEIPKHVKRAEEMIAQCQRMITRMEVYRIALAERFNELQTAPNVPVVRLERYKSSYTGKVTYYLRTFRRYIDSGEQYETSCRTYPGTDRHKALADFANYVKAHPGITAEKEIEKARWEY